MTRPAGYDPRTFVTTYAFEVEDDLLGTELATPKRRLAALLIDLVLASVLAGLGGILVGFAVAYIFVRIATRRRVEQPLKRWARSALALTGALVLFITVVALLRGGWDNPFAGDASTPTDTAATTQPAHVVRDSVVEALAREGLAVDQLQQAGLPPELANWLDTGPPAPDTMDDARAETVALLRRYTEALAANDTARVDSLQAPAAAAVAGPQLQDLRRALDRANERIDTLDDRNEALAERAENPSFLRVIRSTANDVGLRFGWLGVYFSLFLSWWQGQTPGKRLLGLRVVHLDGTPITLWTAFERFGGYAAGLATGLIGFAQVYWDPNRQAIHDRIAQTVVIRTRGS